jgi:signal transduction histidine kinase/CheY-like chemotaxis protein
MRPAAAPGAEPHHEASEAELREIANLMEEAEAMGGFGVWAGFMEPRHARIWWSPYLASLFGRPNELPPTLDGFLEMVHPDDRGWVYAESQRAFARGEALETEHRIVWPNGEIRWVRARAKLESDAEGRPRRLLGLVQDVTEKRRADEERHRTEETLRQAQKMEAVGNLAGGIAHDFNNLLSIILGNTGICLEQIPEDAPYRADLENVLEAGERATALTRQLLAFSRQQPLEPRPLNLNDVILGFERMLKRAVGEAVELELSLARGLHLVESDPGQIEQVLLNLTLNARDAMPHGGRVRIETRNVEPSSTGPSAPPAAGHHVRLSVGDTGVGIAEEHRTRIFEPFFTTKPRGKGTGLGLATVFGIVLQHRGCIDVESEPGRGTTFTIDWPATAVAAPSAENAPPTSDAPDGAGTILLVEDDPMVRDTMHRILTRRGYRVLEAPSGEVALQIGAETDIDLLLTDVIMPQVNGDELAQRLQQTKPALKVLFVSGYADQALISPLESRPGSAFLQKPITPSTLHAKLDELMSAGRSSDDQRPS